MLCFTLAIVKELEHENMKRTYWCSPLSVLVFHSSQNVSRNLIEMKGYIHLYSLCWNFQVREELEAEMKMSLQHLKGYVEEQLFVILGQMESSTKITDHLYLVCFIKHLLFFRSWPLARFLCSVQRLRFKPGEAVLSNWLRGKRHNDTLHYCNSFGFCE